MKVKDQEGQNFPAVSVFHFILNFDGKKKKHFFQELIRQIFHSIFIQTMYPPLLI